MAFKEPYKTYLIESQAIIETDERGKRFPRGTVNYGHFVRWHKYDSPKSNFKDAVRQVTRALLHDHTGFIVYRRVVLGGLLTNDLKALYKAKWGHDNQPFTQYTALGKRWLR